MEENLINLETAKLAKEKGFDIPCSNGYYESLALTVDCGRGDVIDFPYIPPRTLTQPAYGFKAENVFIAQAPTQSLLQKWLRDVHKINLYISYEVIDDSEVAYVWNIIIDIPEGTGRKKDSWDFIKRISSFSEKYMMWYKNYEEALEAGLQEALKLI